MPNRETPRDNSYWQKSRLANYDWEKTTETMYSKKHFIGQNKDIRPLLDYTYHMMYRDDRVILQDRIISDLCASGQNQEDLLLPWVVFTAGAMGAGKGYVMQWLKDQGCFPLEQFVIVDPDHIRQELPEWQGYVLNDPETAAIKTQKEAGHIAEILGYKALRERWNVIFDGSLRDAEWYKLYFARLRHAFPGLRLMIIHIIAEREAVFARAEARGRATGRMVKREVLEQSMDAVPKSVEILAPYVDVAFRVMNWADKEPELTTEPTALNPPWGVPMSTMYLAELWKPIDVDGDGQLSQAEVLAAVALGKITEAVLDTVDVDGDGAITKDELRLAQERCFKGGSLLFRNPTGLEGDRSLTPSSSYATPHRNNVATIHPQTRQLVEKRTLKWSHTGKSLKAQISN